MVGAELTQSAWQKGPSGQASRCERRDGAGHASFFDPIAPTRWSVERLVAPALAGGLKIEAQAQGNGGWHRRRLPAKSEENRGTNSRYGTVAATESL